MAQAHLSRLEFTGPDLRLRVVRRAGHGARRPDGAAASASAAASPPAAVSVHGTDAAAGGAHHRLRARAVGVFLDQHPLQETALTAPGQRVRRGETVALLAIDTLYLPVVADREGIIGERLLEPGAQVDFGRDLFTFVPQT
ncbi:Biotin/lipoyl attachment domain-containing protein [Sodalis praecaptivus]|uniref:Biotin/lipoyl attachment domain-containing protein n=2 Tax=Bruguierivoracaceae TaxID=2812006 RepID=W0HS03_9GAMM|nr:Biotin/lipoyl attachment domain-containing protein [Sodalis praecaptivus]